MPMIPVAYDKEMSFNVYQDGGGVRIELEEVPKGGFLKFTVPVDVALQFSNSLLQVARVVSEEIDANKHTSGAI